MSHTCKIVQYDEPFTREEPRCMEDDDGNSITWTETVKGWTIKYRIDRTDCIPCTKGAELESQLQAATARLEQAEAALRVYSDRQNWMCSEGINCEGERLSSCKQAHWQNVFSRNEGDTLEDGFTIAEQARDAATLNA